MARRKKRGGKSKSVPMAMVVPVVYVVMDRYKKHGLTTDMLAGISKDMTGYNPVAKKFDAGWATPFWMGELVGIIVHKVANKTGVNKSVRKLTGGWLSI